MLDEVTTVKVMSKTNNSANIDHKQETLGLLWTFISR